MKTWNQMQDPQGERFFWGKNLFVESSKCWQSFLPITTRRILAATQTFVLFVLLAKCSCMAHSAVSFGTLYKFFVFFWHIVQKFGLFVLTVCRHLEICTLCFHTFRSQLLLACVLFGRVQMPIHSMFKYFSFIPKCVWKNNEKTRIKLISPFLSNKTNAWLSLRKWDVLRAHTSLLCRV